MQRLQIIQAPGLARPKGYSHGISATGRTLYVAGQLGWEPDQPFASHAFVEQFAKALDNVLAVVAAAGGRATDIVSMTGFVTAMDEFRAASTALRQVWQPRFADYYPAMTVVGVASLVEPKALVELQAVACLEA